MQPSELDRRVSQNRHDIEEIYVKIDQTNETVARIAAVQQEHGAKLDSHGAILADHGTKLDEILRILRGRRDEV